MALTSDIQIDTAGDLKLLVQHCEDWVTFQVSSKAMSLASPVWRTMLDPNGPFRESQSDNNEITFPDDDAKALLNLLLVAHLRFQDVPKELTFEQLLNVCILCDKYDCITLVRPWIWRWQERQIHLPWEILSEEWLFIAWTTGDEAKFRRTAQSLILHANTDESGAFNDARLSELVMPPGFIEGVPEARRQTIAKLIELIHSLVVRKGTDGEPLHCIARDLVVAKDREACDDLSTNSLVSQLRGTSFQMPLWPSRPDEIASRYPGPINELIDNLRKMKYTTHPDGRHSRCGFETDLRMGVGKIEEEMPSGMNDSHRRHMAAQRSKLDQSLSFLGQLGSPRQPSSPEEKN